MRIVRGIENLFLQTQAKDIGNDFLFELTGEIDEMIFHVVAGILAQERRLLRQLFEFFVESLHKIRNPSNSGFEKRHLESRETHRRAVENITREMNLLRDGVLHHQYFDEGII